MPDGRKKPLLCLTLASLFNLLSESPASRSRQVACGFSLSTCGAAQVAGRDPHSSKLGSKTGPPRSQITLPPHGIKTWAYLESYINTFQSVFVNNSATIEYLPKSPLSLNGILNTIIAVSPCSTGASPCSVQWDCTSYTEAGSGAGLWQYFCPRGPGRTLPQAIRSLWQLLAAWKFLWLQEGHSTFPYWNCS